MMRNTYIICFIFMVCGAIFESGCTAADTIKSGQDMAGTFNDSKVEMPVENDAGDANFNNPTGAGGTSEDAGFYDLDSAVSCSEVDLQPKRIIPTIVFVIDGSGSMEEELSGGGQRWTTLREALLDPDEGVIPQLSRIVNFGMVVYSGPEYANQYCPRLSYAKPMMDNYELVESAFSESPPGGSTPTGQAIEWTLENVFSQLENDEEAPQYVVLATDGKPNACVTVNGEEPQTDFDSVIDAVEAIKDARVNVAVLTLAPATGEFAEHLDEVADIGGPNDGTGEALSPENREELVRDITGIVQDAISCEVELQGDEVLEEFASQGIVRLLYGNGESKKLKYEGKNGWELMSEGTRIRLKGNACKKFKDDPSIKLSARFPCIALLG